MNNHARYDQIFMDIFNVEASALGEMFTFQSVDTWDSITHMVLVTHLEDAFEIMLDTEDILGLTSYLDGKKTLAKYKVSL